jgi:hypothetical protein
VVCGGAGAKAKETRSKKKSLKKKKKKKKKNGKILEPEPLQRIHRARGQACLT